MALYRFLGETWCLFRIALPDARRQHKSGCSLRVPAASLVPTHLGWRGGVRWHSTSGTPHSGSSHAVIFRLPPPCVPHRRSGCVSVLGCPFGVSCEYVHDTGRHSVKNDPAKMSSPVYPWRRFRHRECRKQPSCHCELFTACHATQDGATSQVCHREERQQRSDLSPARRRLLRKERPQ